MINGCRHPTSAPAWRYGQGGLGDVPPSSVGACPAVATVAAARTASWDSDRKAAGLAGGAREVSSENACRRHFASRGSGRSGRLDERHPVAAPRTTDFTHHQMVAGIHGADLDLLVGKDGDDTV